MDEKIEKYILDLVFARYPEKYGLDELRPLIVLELQQEEVILLTQLDVTHLSKEEGMLSQRMLEQ